MDNNIDGINSFHYFDLKDDTTWDIEIDKHNSSALFAYHFNKVFDHNQSIKKHSLDLSDSEEQAAFFVDKLNISEIKPIHNECKISFIY